MIKITHKCKVPPLKLDCVFKSDQSQRDSLLQYVFHSGIRQKHVHDGDDER